MASLTFFGPWADPVFDDTELLKELSEHYNQVNVGAIANINVSEKQALEHLENLKQNISSARALAKVLPYRSHNFALAALKHFENIRADIRSELINQLPIATLEYLLDELDETNVFYQVVKQKFTHEVTFSAEVTPGRLAHAEKAAAKTLKRKNPDVESIEFYLEMLRFSSNDEALENIAEFFAGNKIPTDLLPTLVRLSWLNPRLQKKWFASKNLLATATLGYVSIDLEEKRQYLNSLISEPAMYTTALTLLATDPRFNPKNWENELMNVQKFNVRFWSGEDLELDDNMGITMLNQVLTARRSYSELDDSEKLIYLLNNKGLNEFSGLSTLVADTMFDAAVHGDVSVNGQALGVLHYVRIEDLHKVTFTAATKLRSLPFGQQPWFEDLLEDLGGYTTVGETQVERAYLTEEQRNQHRRNKTYASFFPFERGVSGWSTGGGDFLPDGSYIHVDAVKVAENLCSLAAWREFLLLVDNSSWNSDFPRLLHKVPKKLRGVKTQRSPSLDKGHYSSILGDALGLLV